MNQTQLEERINYLTDEIAELDSNYKIQTDNYNAAKGNLETELASRQAELATLQSASSGA